MTRTEVRDTGEATVRERIRADPSGWAHCTWTPLSLLSLFIKSHLPTEGGRRPKAKRQGCGAGARTARRALCPLSGPPPRVPRAVAVPDHVGLRSLAALRVPGTRCPRGCGCSEQWAYYISCTWKARKGRVRLRCYVLSLLWLLCQPGGNKRVCSSQGCSVFCQPLTLHLACPGFSGVRSRVGR